MSDREFKKLVEFLVHEIENHETGEFDDLLATQLDVVAPYRNWKRQVTNLNKGKELQVRQLFSIWHSRTGHGATPSAMLEALQKISSANIMIQKIQQTWPGLKSHCIHGETQKRGSASFSSQNFEDRYELSKPLFNHSRDTQNNSENEEPLSGVDGIAEAIRKHFPDNDWTKALGKNEGARRALLIGNSYDDRKNKDGLVALPGCKASVHIVKEALENMERKGKTNFECRDKTDQTHKQLVKIIEDFCDECDEERVAALLFYFAGHGGNEALEVNDDKVAMEATQGWEFEDGKIYKWDLAQSVTGGASVAVKEGGNFIYGEPDENHKAGKIFKNEIISTICTSTRNVKHRIIIFDCCRGDKNKEMSSRPVFELKMKFSDLEKMYNIDYKNTYVFHSTLPHQVAWAQEKSTKFSNYFSKLVGEVDLSCLDEAINVCLKNDTTLERHRQMIELVKWVDNPFIF